MNEEIYLYIAFILFLVILPVVILCLLYEHIFKTDMMSEYLTKRSVV